MNLIPKPLQLWASICSNNREFLALQEFERSLEILNEPINYYKKKELGTTLLGLCKLIILDDNINNSLFISTKDIFGIPLH